MFFDLNVPITKKISANTSKKGKGTGNEALVSYSPAEIAAVEHRIDLQVHLGYTILSFCQTINKRVDPKVHVNVLNPLVALLRKRPGIVYLKRLNIILDQDSEKGFGLINANVTFFNSYDLLSLCPTTHNTFNQACLTHSLPSNLTAHIISLPSTLPRLPFHLKHTLIRTAIKNGAVFEINYVGSLGAEQEPTLVDANAAESGPAAKRNWWAATRELIRVCKGKGLILSGGCVVECDLRAPRDISNIISILGLAQDATHEASTKTPKSLILRAETRKTYRAVFSEPTVVLPEDSQIRSSVPGPVEQMEIDPDSSQVSVSKRPHEDSEPLNVPRQSAAAQPSKKKKKKPNKSDKSSS
ncbi:RNase P subunit p30-domain-containing protein [Crepidotus variabilis]|uniref:RNase P subunit p30-domain-containing protein n=1 Tax=Crepidotus variabilis TaxID=179855 RepID=A0A9P6E9A5_9AGAR|nr:RNase P subunit p30-domain-containing protein [Crepidotus variabilis]